MNKDAFFSSKTDQWPTPQEFFNRLNKEFEFTLDPCADAINAKCAKFYDTDGLTRAWAPERVFMNPPYGREIGAWIEKAYRETLIGAVVVCLIPARTDTRYWHEYVMKAQEIRLIKKGRLCFGAATIGAPFPSAVVVFNGQRHTPPLLSSMRAYELD